MAKEKVRKLSTAEFASMLAEHEANWNKYNCGLIEHKPWLKIENCSLLDVGESINYRNFRCIKFINVIFPWVISHSTFKECSFFDCDCMPYNFDHVTMYVGYFENCTFFKTAFDFTNIYAGSFKDCDLINVRFVYSTVDLHGLINCKFSSQYLFRSDIAYELLTINDSPTSNSIAYNACPTDGKFIGWKKLIRPATKADIAVLNVAALFPIPKSENVPIVECICKLEIPASAKRSSGLDIKCRASKVKVLEIRDIKSGAMVDEAFSIHTPSFKYKVGETIKEPNFDDNRWNTCSSGIHFFVDKQTALDYEL